MSRPTRTRYKTTNWPEYNAALKRRDSLTIWLDPQMQWEATPSGRRGRQQFFSDAAIQTCLTMKVLFDMALRQATGFVESLLQLIGLDWKVPDFSTLRRRQKTLVVDIASGMSSEPLHLLIDSTGIKVEGEGEWHARKHGVSSRRVWQDPPGDRRADVGSVRRRGHQQQRWRCPMLPELLDQISKDQEIGSVTADGAYDTRKSHDAIAGRGAHAVIPTRKNAKPWKPDTVGAKARNDILRATRHLGRALWRRWSDYHRRSRVETMRNCLKLLGQRLMARDFDRQVAEIQNRIAGLNR